MNNHQKDQRTTDDQLANFTDQILERTIEEDKAGLSPDPELRALEQTTLRLKNTFREDGPSEAVIQKMRQNIMLEWKQRERKASKSFWRRFVVMLTPREQKWQSQSNQQRWSVLGSLFVASVVMLVSIIVLNKADFDQPAASGQGLNMGVLAGSAVLALVALWFFRRK